LMNIKGRTSPGRNGLSLLDAVWHLLNGLAPAVLVPLIAAGLTKLVWRRSLASVRWWPLAWPACVAGLVVTLAGLVLLGRDGKMATYAALVLVTATWLWWRGLRRA
jgi:hypothetical protein